MWRVGRLRASEWLTRTQFTGDCFLQSMMGHGLTSKSNGELVDKLVGRGFLVVSNPDVITAIKSVDRAAFLPIPTQSHPVYSNNPQRISKHHYMSTPQLHAQVISLLSARLGPGNTAMEIGCGTGFLPAVFSALRCTHVYGIENDAELLKDALRLSEGTNVQVADILPKEAIFDAVYVAPYFDSFQSFEEFLASLRFNDDAVCVAPVQTDKARVDQQLVLMTRDSGVWKQTDLFTVLCEPLRAS